MFPFIEPSWQDSLVSLLVAINAVSGAPERNAVVRPLTPTDVVAIAQSLESRSYRPDQWFAVGTTTPQAVRTAAPALNPGARYELTRYGAEPSGMTQISSRAGGLLFEDPFYAVLAGYNIGLQASPAPAGQPVEVKVSSRDQAWAQRQRIVDELRQGSYRADRYFAVSGPAHAVKAGGSWGSGGVSAADLDKLVVNGRTGVTFGESAPALYGLYRYVAP